MIITVYGAVFFFLKTFPVHQSGNQNISLRAQEMPNRFTFANGALQKCREMGGKVKKEQGR